MAILTSEETDLIEEIFAGYHLGFVSGKEALEDLEKVLKQNNESVTGKKEN